MDTLTRDDAIKRIRDIKNGRSIGHLTSIDGWKKYHMGIGAIAELMAIFDIKEDEIL